MKKIILLSILAILFSTLLIAQSIGINNNTPDASAILDIKSSTKGLLAPRMNSAQRVAIATPANGLMLYDTDTKSFWFYNSTTWSNLSAAGSTGWLLTGNSGTNPATNFIGTADAQPLRFRVNNLWAGEIHPTSGNLFLGLGAGQVNSSGLQNIGIGENSLSANTQGGGNTANGYNALSSNTIGTVNTAIGYNALFNNSTGGQSVAIGRSALFTQSFTNSGISWSSYNTAVGYMALFSNEPVSTTTGVYNTAVGHSSLRFNTTGASNTAYGNASLNLNTTGNFNTAVGDMALRSNTTASHNTAIGVNALNTQSYNNGGNAFESGNVAVGYNALYLNQPTSTTNGRRNTAVGSYALQENSYGVENTAIGYGSLLKNTNGYANTALGSGALNNNTFGVYNTAIGYNALTNNVGGSNNIAIGNGSGTVSFAPYIDNTIGIGNDDLLNGSSNQVLIGNLSMIRIGGHQNWGVYSDDRIKNTIVEDVKGLDFILKLRPVTYHISSNAIRTISGNKETPDFPGKYDAEKIKHSGFLAQEVEKAAKATGYDFSGYTVPKNQNDLYTIRYAEFVVPLVKAVQEQQAIIKTLQQQMDLLMKRIDAAEKKQ